MTALRPAAATRSGAAHAHAPASARAALLALALVLVAGTLSCGSEEEPPQRVFVLVVDTLRHDALGCNAGRDLGTPRMDALAGEGVRFEQAISSSGWTLPSVASLLTGTWPTLHKALGKKTLLTPVSPDVPLLAEIVREQGFTTLGFVNAAFLSPVLGIARGFDLYDHRHAYNREIRRADETVDSALAAIAARRDEPLFVLLHVFDPHLDYDPLPQDLAAFVPEPRSPAPPLAMLDCRGLERGRRVPAAEDIDYVRQVYQAEVAAVDRAIGRFLDGLRELGMYEGSTIVLTADHGEELWDHGGFEHGHSLHDELIRVPLVIKPPADLGLAGGTVADQVRVLDVAPTLLELLALPAPPSFVGRSLLPLARGEAEEERVAFSEGTLYGSDKLSWRTSRWQYILDQAPDAKRPEQLYDWRADPGTRVDLMAEEPVIAAQLRQRLLAFHADLRLAAAMLADSQVHDLHPSAHDELLESLESLGYTGREE